MLQKPIFLGDDITLVMRSGIQFVDFGLKLDLRKMAAGGFIETGQENALVMRLDHDAEKDVYLIPRNPGEGAGSRQQTAKPRIEVELSETVALFEDLWLPLPVFRVHGSTRFVEGPTNWARGRLVTLRPGEDPEGDTHRLILSFDTNVAPTEIRGARYLAPTKEDVDGGAKFALAWRAGETGAFCARGEWVWNWLEEVFRENASQRLKLDPEQIEEMVAREHRHLAHYQNFLWLIGTALNGSRRPDARRAPEFTLISHQGSEQMQPIAVDLVLDVGNSRTVGILIEDHPQESDGLKNRYVLQLRDLSRPHLVHAEPFESRVEFAEAVFGKVDHSRQSGRQAFEWPTIARVGPEAARLASRRRGGGGSTGLSSPKRYLWDDERYLAGWRFNDAFNKGETLPQATASPFSDLITDQGEALYACSGELPVFNPRYSRSSLMTFMLAEVLVQALNQMNSPGQRARMKQSIFPRHLRSVILTVPPSMPKPERMIFENRVRQAIALVWKAMGWHEADAPVSFEGEDPAAWLALPSVVIQWDEATCAQVVWLYSEIVNSFGGRPEEFFQVARRNRAEGGDKRMLRVASIDIGGGTTDLVISDYKLDSGRGVNVYIQPAQVFRDGFKVAGDDIVLEVITKMVVPAISASLRAAGVADPGPVIGRLMGSDHLDIQDAMARQQLTLQVLYPMALRILKEYEGYDPRLGAPRRTETLSAFFSEADWPSEEVLGYVRRSVRAVAGVADFDLMAVEQPVDLGALHAMFLGDNIEIAKTIKALCEVVYLYDVDWLLVSGRPSRLPGVQHLFRLWLPLPPDRILPLHDYRTGDWYPFSSRHRITDPKTTAAVGAMMCMLSAERRLSNFFFLARNFKITSTVRHIGPLDGSKQQIKDEEVIYRDVDFDDPDYEFPDIAIDMRGPTLLGFRQLASPRWNGSPLYSLEFADKTGDKNKARTELDRDNPDTGEAQVLKVKLSYNRSDKSGYGQVRIKDVAAENGQSMRGTLRLRLLTLSAVGLKENAYWLDTGNIAR